MTNTGCITMRLVWCAMRVNVKVKANTKEQAAAIRKASDLALTDLGWQVVKDSNLHAPREEGDLQRSAITNSDEDAQDGTFTARWSTPYAHYQWAGKVMYGPPGNRTYGPETLSYTSSLAVKEWTEHAAEVYGDQWRQVFGNALREELRRLG